MLKYMKYMLKYINAVIHCINYNSTFVMDVQRLFPLLLPKGCWVVSPRQSCVQHL